MAWRAVVQKKAIQGRNLVAVVQFEDSETGRTKVQEIAADDLTTDSLTNYCAERIATLTETDRAAVTLAPALAAIPLGLLDTENPKPPPASAADVFFANRGRLIALRIAHADGLVQKNDDELVAREATNAATFDRAFLADMRWR